MAREPETVAIAVTARITSSQEAALWMTIVTVIIELANDPRYRALGVKISGG
jgi:hypothetical protein